MTFIYEFMNHGRFATTGCPPMGPLVSAVTDTNDLLATAPSKLHQNHLNFMALTSPKL